MTRVRTWPVLAFSTIAVFALGAAVALGLTHVSTSAGAMTEALPAITLPTIVVAGLVDGINPCAFTVLLLFITALLATVQASGSASVGRVRARIMGLGSIYIAAIFLTYLALGIGILATADIFVRDHLSARIGALLAILFGLWMLKDFFLPNWGPRLSAPGVVGDWARRAAQRMTIPAMIVGGFLIGLCTVPCSGAVYLAVLALLAAQTSAALGYAYLVLYNLMFVLPLLVVLIAASSRPTLNRLAHWNLHHKEWVRLALGGGVVAMGLVILITL